MCVCCEIHVNAGLWLVEVLQRGQHETTIICLQAMQFVTLKLCAIPTSKWLIGINFLSAWLQAVLCWRHRCCGKRCKFCTMHRSQQSSGQRNWVELNLEVCGWMFYFLTYFLHFLQVVVNINGAGDGVHFRRAGPRDKVFTSICYLISIPPTFVSLPTLWTASLCTSSRKLSLPRDPCSADLQ